MPFTDEIHEGNEVNTRISDEEVVTLSMNLWYPIPPFSRFTSHHRFIHVKSTTNTRQIKNLILANHILHYHHVLDAYGHISVRQPGQSDVFLMSGDRAPALVSSVADIIRYRVSDASPVEPGAKKGYQERFIHSEIYKRFPDVMSVIHSHSEAVLPYTMSGVEMKPCFHIAGFLGEFAMKFSS